MIEPPLPPSVARLAGLVLLVLAASVAAAWERPPTLEPSYLIFNRWEPLKRDGAEQYRVAELDLFLHLPLLDGHAGGARLPAWLTLRTNARMMDLPGYPIVTPTIEPSLNTGWFVDLPGGAHHIGLEARVLHDTNAQTGPTLTAPADIRPGMGRFNEHAGRFTTDAWRVMAVWQSTAHPALIVTQSYRHELIGPDSGSWTGLEPDLRSWYPAARARTELRWDVETADLSISSRGFLEITFDGAYSTRHQHYPNTLVESSVFARHLAWIGEHLGLFARYQAGFDEYNILFTTKAHELVAGLVWSVGGRSFGQ